MIQQSVYGISIAGWALDPDATAPVRIDVYDGASGHSITADGDRTDVAAAFPGQGAAHGFSERFDASPGTHRICIFAINGAGGGSNTLLTCKNVAIERVNPFDQFDTGGETMGLIETADTNPNGTLHVSGFIYDEDTGAIPDSTRLCIYSTTGSIGLGLRHHDPTRPERFVRERPGGTRSFA